MSRASPDAAVPPAEPVYYPIKWVLDAQNASVPICMQARNGPCALLALVNVNLQSRAFALEPGTTRMREDHLMAILADFVSARPVDPADTLREHAVADFLDLLPRLNKGMDINVRFNAPTSFEFTRELGVFDIFPSVRLLHGWLVDPQDIRLASALGTLTYNQVIDELVRTASPPPPPPPDQPAQTDDPQNDLVHTPSAPPLEAFDFFQYDEPDPDPDAPPPQESDSSPTQPALAPVALLPEESAHTTAIREVRPFVMDFLESNQTQLTVYGLTELHSALTDSERAILFRNSHFYVIQKHAGELYTLVTDVGYFNELNTVWEKLSDVNGDSTFYNGSFQRISENGTTAGASAVKSTPTAGQRPQNFSQPPRAPSQWSRASNAANASNSSQGPQRPNSAPWPQRQSMWAMPPNPHSTPGASQGPHRPARPSSMHGRKASDKCVVQ